MLSLSKNKLQQNQYVLIVVILILALLLAVAAYRWATVPALPAGQDSLRLSAAEITAYRWGEMSRFYSSQSVGIPITGENLTAFSAADASAYRWQAIARFYMKQESAKIKYGPPGR